MCISGIRPSLMLRRRATRDPGANLTDYSATAGGVA
jgi:hypothetical protein